MGKAIMAESLYGIIMWECMLGVRHTGCPISDLSYANPSLVIQNVSRADIPGKHGRRLLNIRGEIDAIDDFADDCRDHDDVLSYERLSRTGRGEQYVAVDVSYEGSNPSIQGLINMNGIFHNGSIMVREGIEHWLVYSAEKTTIQELEAELESYDNEVSLYRMVDLSELGPVDAFQYGTLLSELTDRQQTVFRTALDMGYYDEEQDTTVSDIADELGVHETTAWEHLSKTENLILTEIGGDLFAPVESKSA